MSSVLLVHDVVKVGNNEGNPENVMAANVEDLQTESSFSGDLFKDPFHLQFSIGFTIKYFAYNFKTPLII